MKKSAYIQLGLILVAFSLYFLRTREGLEDFSSPTCSNGTQPTETGSGPMCEIANTPRVCEPGYTVEGEGCRSADGTNYYSPPGCPDGFLPAGDKCIKREPAICPPGTELYGVMALPSAVREGLKCVPTSVSTYEAKQLPAMGPGSPQPSPSELANICKAGDKLGFKSTPGSTPVCLATGSTATTTPTESSPEDISTSKTVIQQVIDSLKPFRPPTAPSSDIEKERKEITDIAKRNLFFIQAALFLVVLAMLTYLMFPLETANLIAFALLCVGIAMGFFLRR